MYSAMTPRHRICTPLTKHMMHVMLAQPGTDFPHSAVMSAQMQNRKLTRAITKPRPKIMLNGFTERLVTPSTARPIIFFRG